MNRKLFKTGHSLAVTISRKFLDALGLKIGDNVKVELDANDEAIVIRHGKKQNQLALRLPIRLKLGQKKEK